MIQLLLMHHSYFRNKYFFPQAPKRLHLRKTTFCAIGTHFVIDTAQQTEGLLELVLEERQASSKRNF